MTNYNYYSAVILICWLSLLVLGVLVSENNRLSQKEKSFLYLSYLLIALAAFTEWLGIHLNGNKDIPAWVLRAVKCCDYILTPTAGSAIVLYFKSKTVWKKIIRTLLIGNTVFQLVSFFTGWMINIDENAHYSHGRLYFVYMAFYLILMFFLAAEFISYGRHFKRQNRFSLHAVMFLVLAGVLMQEALGSEIRTAYLALTLGMTLMFIHINEFAQLTSDDTIEQQQMMISTDVMTGMLSRYAYGKQLHEMEEKASTDPYNTVFSIDINGLKTVNDTLGHAAGDELIRAAAGCIMKTFSKDSICYRTGGDEFIVFSEISKEQAPGKADALKKSAALWHGNFAKELHLAIGFAAQADHKELSPEKLVSVADEKMYKEKDAYYKSIGKQPRY